MSESRPLRTCAKCGVTDDHPRHVVGAVVGSGDEPVNFHMDCHAQLGCRVCLHQLGDAAGATGDDLRAHLSSLSPLTPDQVADLYAKENSDG